MLQDLGTTIKIYPDIFQAALNAKDDPAHRLWLLSIYLNGQRGSGWILVDDLHDYARDMLDIADRQIDNLIDMGEDIFWACGRGKVYIYSPNKVSTHYNLGQASQPILLPIEALSGLQRTNAYCYAAWIKTRQIGMRTDPIARSTICELFNVSKTTLRRWEYISKIDKEANYAVAKLDQAHILPQDAPRMIYCACGWYCNDTLDNKPLVLEHKRNCGQDLVIVVQRSNSYSANQLRTAAWGSRGFIAQRRYRRKQAQKSRREAKSRTNTDSQTDKVVRPAGHFLRQNFRLLKSAQRALSNRPTDEIYALARLYDVIPAALSQRGRCWFRMGH